MNEEIKTSYKRCVRTGLEVYENLVFLDFIKFTLYNRLHKINEDNFNPLSFRKRTKKF